MSRTNSALAGRGRSLGCIVVEKGNVRKRKLMSHGNGGKRKARLSRSG